MHGVNLAGVDLNLLVVFDAVMTERSVTRAAARIGLTQPACSHALARLRALFGDPLFVPTPRGMVPTPAALAVGDRVAEILRAIEGVLDAGAPFDPARAEQLFTIGLSDYAAFLLLPGLVVRVAREAPGVRLVVRHTSHDLGPAMLADGAVSVIVGHFPPPGADLAETVVFHDRFVVAGRAGHPAFDAPLTLERFVALDHLHVSLRGEPQGQLDRELRRHGAARRVAVTVGHFLVAPFVIAAGDLVATEPARLLTPLAARLGLTLVEPPLALPPFRVSVMWHRRTEADPPLVWLRGVIAALAGVTPTAPGGSSARADAR